GSEVLKVEGNRLSLVSDSNSIPVDSRTPLFVEGPLILKAQRVPIPSTLSVIGELQGHSLKGLISWEGIEIVEGKAQTHFPENPYFFLPWLIHTPTQATLPISPQKESGVLLTKSFQEGGVCIGDPGYLSYTIMTAGSLQEQRLPIFVA